MNFNQKERALIDIPASEVDQVVNDFKSEGAKIIKELQADGNWTVRATFYDSDKSRSSSNFE